MAVKGIERVQAGFAKITEDIDRNKTDAAVYAILQEGAGMSQMMVPISEPNLINTLDPPIIEHINGKTTGTVGYYAPYAGYVHEMPGKLKGLPRPNNKGNYWDLGGEPKFLTKGFEEIKPMIPSILKREYGV